LPTQIASRPTAAGRFRGLRVAASVAALGLALVEPVCALPQPTAGTSPTEVRLTLAAATYVRLVITPAPVDVVVRRSGPAGTPPEQVPVPRGGKEPTHVSFLAAAAGDYRFEAVPSDPQLPGGGYALALEELRPAGACDAARVRAERALFAAQVELDRPGGDAAAARALSREAMVASSEVGEREETLAALLETARAARRQRLEPPRQPAGPRQPPDPRQRQPKDAQDPESAETAAGLLQRALDLARAVGNRYAEAAALEAMAELPPGDLKDLPLADQLQAANAALDLRRTLGDELGEIEALQWVGHFYDLAGATKSELPIYEEALALAWRNDDVRGEISTLRELGALHDRLGETDRGRAYLAIALNRAHDAHDPVAEAQALEECARLDIDLGELQAANDEYTAAYGLLVAAGSQADAAGATPSPAPEALAASREVFEELARCMDGMAFSLLYLGEPEKAQRKFAAALAAFEALHDPRGRATELLGLGSAQAAAGETDGAAGALASFRQALDLIRASGLRDLQALALYDLARVQRKLRQPQPAVGNLEEALGLEADDLAARARTLVELGNAYGEVGRADAAEQAFERAIAACGGVPVVEAPAQAGLARLRRDRGDLAAALAAIQRALAITEQVRSGVLRPDQRVSFLEARRAYYELDVDLLMRLASRQPGAGHDAAALAVSEQARARGLLDLLARERVDVRQRIAPELKASELAIGAAISTLQQRLLAPSSRSLPAADVERLRRELADAEEKEEELDAEILKREPSYPVVFPPPVLALQEIQGLLDERTALLEFFLGKESSYLFVVTRDGLAAHALPPKAEIARLVAAVRDAVDQAGRLGARHYADEAYRLYTALALSAAELRDKPNWIVAPDEVLHLLSFEVLLTRQAEDGGALGRDLPYLIREHAVSYVPSASVLAQLLRAHRAAGGGASQAKTFVGFGDPGAGALDPRRPLPGARDEVGSIAGLFAADRALVFTGAEATEDRVKTSPAVTWARYLHFASHGILDEEQPARSGLQLARAAGSVEDGLLQVREVFNLELHADLVVLSACQTGLGKQVSGEGLIGMTRAFLYAGAASVVVSLWQVDDASTADLMVSFYRHLQESGDKAAALRLAKLDLIAAGYSRPYYWAPFILIGQPR
jgi:CHAT domain-containing protein